MLSLQGSNPRYSTSGFVPEITTDYEIESGSKVTLCFWDTNGRETFSSFTPLVYQEYHCLIVLYDLTREDTLTNIPHFFGRILMSSDAPLKVLLGNKADLAGSVPQNTAVKVAGNYKFDMIEDVPFDKNQLDNVFARIVESLMGKVSLSEISSSANNNLKGTTDGLLELAAKCASAISKENLDKVMTQLNTLLVPMLEATGNTNLRFISEIIQEYSNAVQGNQEGILLWLFKLTRALLQLRQQPAITSSPDATAEPNATAEPGATAQWKAEIRVRTLDRF